MCASYGCTSFLYTTSFLIQTLRPVMVSSDQNTRWQLHPFFTNKKQKFLVLFPSPERPRLNRIITVMLHTCDM